MTALSPHPTDALLLRRLLYGGTEAATVVCRCGRSITAVCWLLRAAGSGWDCFVGAATLRFGDATARAAVDVQCSWPGA